MSREKIEEMARDLSEMIGNSPKLQAEKLYAKAYRKQSEVIKEVLEKAASKFAGHSDYHGDTILQVLYCMAEGKEVNDARPLNAKQTEVANDINVGSKSEWISVEERLRGRSLRRFMRIVLTNTVISTMRRLPNSKRNTRKEKV